MKMFVKLFDPDNPPSIKEQQRLVQEALAAQGGALMDLGRLLHDSFEDGRDHSTLGGADTIAILRPWIKERYEIIDDLEDQFNAIEREDDAQRRTATVPTASEAAPTAEEQ